MYAVIAGGGDIGSRLATSLVDAGHEVFLLDTDARVVTDLRARLGAIAEVGDASKVSVLGSAGVARSELFFATTGRDEVNLAACQIAKLRFNAPRTVALVRNADNLAVFEAVGVDESISDTDVVFSRLASALPAHPLVRLMTIQGRQKEIVAVKVPRNGAVAGKPFKELNLPYGCVATLVIDSSGQTNVPTDEMIVNAEDEILFVTPVESTDAILEIVTEPA